MRLQVFNVAHSPYQICKMCEAFAAQSFAVTLVRPYRRQFDPLRDGTLTESYASGNTVIGVDVDRQALAECHRRLGIETRWHDLTDGLPFADAAFDAVVASELLEHVPFPERVVGEIARVLRPDGLFIGSVPNAFRLKNSLLFLLGREPERDPTHLRRFSAAGVRRLLAQQFTGVQIVPAFGRLVWLHGPWFANSLLWRGHTS